MSRALRMTADGVATACLVDTCIGRVGVVRKCLAESPLVRHVCGTPLLSWCNFWDTVKCHIMHWVTAEWSKCISTGCLVEPCTGRLGVV